MTNKREFYPYYIGPNDKEIALMLSDIGDKNLDDLFKHLPKDCHYNNFEFDKDLNREELEKDLIDISNKNKLKLNFLGDGLFQFKVPEVISEICNIRGLTTAYTPYQPERSQGTLETLWIYQSLIAKLTGFKAVNASLYERSTCLFEALNCAIKINRSSNKVLVPKAIYPGDKEVLDTLKVQTKLEIIYYPQDESGKVNIEKLRELISQNDFAAIAINQINSFGVIEDFNQITTLAKQSNLLVISLVELFTLSNNGLKEPSLWGENNEGADMLVAEGQHLTLDANYGGPGLGVFAIKFDEKNKNMIRSAAGRFIGLAKDSQGNSCKTIVLSTREQHIRREKATSNICSNQSFVASICGASLLSRGSTGLDKIYTQTQKNINFLINELTCLKGVDLKYPGPFFNQFTLVINSDLTELIKKASEYNLDIGHDISHRTKAKENLLLIATSDIHGPHELQKLVDFFHKNFSKESISNSYKQVHKNEKRQKQYKLKSFSDSEILEYYQALGKENFSPDNGLYPLGSCTMKYNPEINDWAANLEGFTKTHPQACSDDVQGNLQVLHYIQTAFEKITGLPAVTTQPVAGAQGELVGLKMFQAYHKDKGQKETRNIILIPKTAHGTNPATASMAGFESKTIDNIKYGIIAINAKENGEMDLEHVQELTESFADRIAGCMITNPNTSGIFETNFKKISDLIHKVGGLVYMDGANMNAIAGRVDLNKLGVDAVHNNLHKTWSIPHGGGGPGDAIVAVSEKLIDYLPGEQIILENNKYKLIKPKKSIGSFHRHKGNFAHKVRAYTYLRALGHQGIQKMSAVAVLNARYLYHHLKDVLPSLPNDQDNPRMHEFILTLSEDHFKKIAEAGTPKSQAISKVGKLFLDFGFHAPTVAFPETFGLMFEPTESFTKKELDEFIDTVKTITNMLGEYPELLITTPHFSPIAKVDELKANRELILNEDITDQLTPITTNGLQIEQIKTMRPPEIINKILELHKERIKVLF